MLLLPIGLILPVESDSSDTFPTRGQEKTSDWIYYRLFLPIRNAELKIQR